MAESMSDILIGKTYKGIWNTGICVFGKEFYYGHGGICVAEIGKTPFGKPARQIEMGTTEKNENVFFKFLKTGIH